MKSLYVFTNGNETTWPSIAFSAWMSSKLDEPLTLVGILENRGENDAVEEIFSRAVTDFQQKGIQYTLQLETGPAEAVIPRKAADEAAGMVVTGPLGRPALRRFFAGRSFRHILAEVEKPLLYVPAAKIPVQKILVCLGGLGYGLTAESMGVRLARAFQASLTLLTVVPPIDLDYPEARAIRENWQNLAATDTLPGRTLRQATEIARKAQVKAKVITRQGDTIEEIRAEIRAGGYDLVCMGSPYSSQSLRQMATANITAEIAESAPCPVLAVRYMERE
jgi:nucleotide-binding universal stress UspA family protein